MKQITISRYHSDEDAKDQRWKELISALVLVGYEVYGDEDKIVFTLGHGDEVTEKEDE